MNTKSQEAQILKWLERGRKLTALTALEKFGCLRLSGRVYDLRKAGHVIESKSKILPNGKRVAEYSLIKKAS